jgi:hypothetical protein
VRRTTFTIAVLVFSLCALGQNPGLKQPGSEASQQQLAPPYYQMDFPPVVANGSHAVSWDKGQLVSFSVGEMNEPVAFYDRNGQWLFENRLTFERAAKTYIQDANATGSGTAVVAASVVNSDGAVADVIAEVGRDGIRRVLRTSSFYPLKVCVTDGGTVWAYGKELTEDRRVEPRARYPMLREFSFDKGGLRSELDRITIRPAKNLPIEGARGEVQMRCNSTSVVIVSGVTNELLEYDLSRSKLSRWPMIPLPEAFYINGAALTDSGKIYVSAFRPGQNAQTGIFQFQVNSLGTAEWTPLTTTSAVGGKFFILLGNEGEDLVYSLGRRTPTLFWVKTQKEMAK